MNTIETFDFDLKGHKFRAYIEQDDDHEAPWIQFDGHGVVTGWTTRSKAPHERLLHSDRGSKRFYDVAASLERAGAKGWGVHEKKLAELTRNLGRTPTQKEITAEAVKKDFEHLYDWCNDEWCYVGVCVVKADEDGVFDINERYDHALWGIESNSDEYIRETANDLAKRLLDAEDRTAWEQAHAYFGLDGSCQYSGTDKADYTAQWREIQAVDAGELRAVIKALLPYAFSRAADLKQAKAASADAAQAAIERAQKAVGKLA